MTDFPYIGGIEVSAIKNREFIRIETDKAQAIVVALDKSNIPFSARFGDAEMVLTYDGSYKEQVEEIIAKAQSGDYEALLRELQVYGVPDGYYRLLGEVAELLNTTVSFLQSRPDDVQLLLCKFYVDLWLCDRATLQRELDRIITVNGRTLSDISEYERKKQQEKTPAEPVQTADKVHSFAELYDEYQRRHANDHFTREAHKHLAEIALRRQRDEQERVTQTEEREQKGRTDHEEVYHHRKCGYRSSHNRSCCHRKAQKVRWPMPVQDNDDKRTTDQPAVDAEEELRRKQAQAQEQQQEESGAQKSDKLLPFLNAKAEHHQSRIDSLDEKIANQTDKIDRNKAKIEALSAKADKLEDTNRMLKATIGNLPGIRTLIANNEKRIQAIREVKIPKRQEKIDQGWKKIDTLTAKRDRIEHKLNRVIALNDTIKSFGIHFNKERREAFADAMTRLNSSTVDCLSDKKATLEAKKQAILDTYNAPETSAVDKLKLGEQLKGVNERIGALESKIMKLARPETHYEEQTNDQLDASMILTGEKLGEMVQNGTMDIPSLAEGAVQAAQEVETLDRSQVASIADKLIDQPLASAEMQMEDDYNMIDGIINNGSKEDIDKARAELREGIKNMENLAENPFVPQEMRENATAELEKMRKQLELLDSVDEIEVESWLMTMVDNGDAVLTDDGGFKVNPDYYKELPRGDRHVETMTEIQAVEVMSALTAAGVAYSAATKGEDKVGITVSKNDVPALNDVMYASIGKIAHTEAAKENGGKGEKGKYQTINPEYYASLGKDDKHTRVEPIATARKIVAELQKQNIPYSAVVRKNDTVAVTVSKANVEAYKQIESAVKGERAVEYVNPDFFKSLPKQERFTQRMDEGQARKKSAELTAKGVEHSAVFGGEKSAVTVAKKDSQRAFFSRGRMQRDAQRISGRGQQKSQQREQTPKKRKNQGLE